MKYSPIQLIFVVDPENLTIWLPPGGSDFWGPQTKFLNDHISAPIYARIMCYSSLELLSCIKVFILCELSPQMNIWRRFYEKHQNYGGSHIGIQYGYHKRAQIFGVHIKINCMRLYFICTKFGGFLKKSNLHDCYKHLI